MTDQNAIPAEKVRELAAKYDGDMPTDAHFLLGEIKADLRALLPTQQPTTGLLGRWAKHPEHGDVVCMWDRPDPEGKMHVRWVDESFPMSTGRYYVPLSDLTFPEQATKPEDVPAGEAWLVDVEDSEESHKSIVALKYACDDWRTSDGVTNCIFWQDSEVTLISPLTPERPGKDDLQVKYDALDKNWCYLDGKYSTLRKDYDALDAKYREAQERIKTLERERTPITVSTREEYDALPEGSQVQEKSGSSVWQRRRDGLWRAVRGQCCYKLHDNITRTVLRYGWGDEQPVWRIEHDWRNLRGDEYIIDKNGDPVVTETKHWAGEPWYTDSLASVVPEYARFIVFPNKDSATPEAIEEAMKERDKERE